MHFINKMEMDYELDRIIAVSIWLLLLLKVTSHDHYKDFPRTFTCTDPEGDRRSGPLPRKSQVV